MSCPCPHQCRRTFHARTFSAWLWHVFNYVDSANNIFIPQMFPIRQFVVDFSLFIIQWTYCCSRKSTYWAHRVQIHTHTYILTCYCGESFVFVNSVCLFECACFFFFFGPTGHSLMFNECENIQNCGAFMSGERERTRKNNNPNVRNDWKIVKIVRREWSWWLPQHWRTLGFHVLVRFIH